MYKNNAEYAYEVEIEWINITAADTKMAKEWNLHNINEKI